MLRFNHDGINRDLSAVISKHNEEASTPQGRANLLLGVTTALGLVYQIGQAIISCAVSLERIATSLETKQ